MSPDAFLPREIADRPVEIALGRNREDKNFRTLKGTFKQLFEDRAPLSYFVEGEKDGLCLLQGALIGGQRIARNVTKNYLMMFDHDTGETIDEIEAKIADKGLFAVLWTTYNHMQAETLVAEDALLKWLRKNGHKSDNISASQVAEFLQETKKVKPEVFSGDLKLDRIHVEGGMKYRLKHAPMPRVRSMFLLNEPFDFGARGSSQVAAIQEWKERYAGLASMLGVSWDRSCVDPSRLMYTPRVARLDDIEKLGHDIIIIPGAALDIDKVPRLETEPRAGVDRRQNGSVPDLASALKGEDQGSTYLPWIISFIAKHGRDFEAAECFAALFPEDIRSDRGDKIEFACPNEESHSEQKHDDRAFWITNASSSESGFYMGCLHNTCIESSKKDRAWYLDGLCKKYGLTEDDLLGFCPEEIVQNETQEDERTKIEDILHATDFASRYRDADARKELMRRIACAWPSEADRKIRARQIATALGSAELRHALLKEIKNHDATVTTSSAPPTDPDTYDGAIDPQWDAKTQVNITIAQLQRVNKFAPKLFCGAAAPVVRVVHNALGCVIDKVSSVSQWQNILTRTLEYGDGEHFPGELVSCVRGHPDFSFPVLARVIDVPVFAADGSLKTEAGYHAELEAWFEPAINYFSVPDVISEEDLYKARGWIDEAIRDFPFSDVCGGGETEPIYLDGSDDGEGWKLPNLKRGVSSRAHFYALMLNGFIVDLIDGVTPLFHIDKDKFNTGATLLANVALITLMGKAPAQSMDHKSDGEQEKRITSNLKAGLPAVLMDNVNDKLMGGSLAAMLTAQHVSQRLLGGNENLVVKNRITWITTGTGTEFSKEVLRRVLPIFLDAGEADPKVRGERGDIKHKDLTTWLIDNRSAMVWACHVLIRYAIQRGLLEKATTYDGPSIDSFGRWSAVMGTLLSLIGVPGFLGNLKAFSNAKGDDHENETDIVYELWQTFTNGRPEALKFTAKEAWERVGMKLSGLSGAMQSEHAGTIDIGRRLNKVRGTHEFIDQEDGTIHRVRVTKTSENGRTRYRVVTYGTENR